MSTKNKFLPFVTERTPLHAVGKKLWKSSYGINKDLVLSILVLIESAGIEKVRAKIENSSLDNVEQKYRAMLNSSGKGVPEGTYDALLNLGSYMTDEDWREVAVPSDRNIFIVYALYLNSSEKERNEYNFGVLQHLNELLDDKIPDPSPFADNRKPLFVNSLEDVKAYVYYCKYLSSGWVAPVTLVRGKP